MGQETRVGAGDPLRRSREVHVRALSAAARWLDIVLLRNCEEIARARWTPDRSEVVFRDDHPLEALAVRDAPFHPEPIVVYYVRVDSQLDQTQWSSPIWLDLPT
jgi:hypothetical protein